MAVRIIGEINRHLIEPISAVYFGTASGALLDAHGNSLIGELPEAPMIIGTIANREYTVGGSPVTIDLATKFSGATSYSVTPTPAGVSLAGAILTINPAMAVPQTAITVRGINSGGQSDPVTFNLTVQIAQPELTEPLDDVSLIVGDGNLVIDLREHFTGATSYGVTPTGQGVTISGYNMTISAVAERAGDYTVTASNSSGTATDTFALIVAPMPQVALSLDAVESLNEDDPVGTLVATFETDADEITLDGPDAGLLEIDDVDVITSAALTGRTEVSFSVIGNKSGHNPAIRSATVDVVEATVAPAVTSDPVISGTTDPSGDLTLNIGSASGAPAPSSEIEWLFDGDELPDEDGTTLDKDGRIGPFRARVTWTNSAGTISALSNIITTAVAEVAPSVTGQPEISGGTAIGEVQTCDPGTASGNPAPTPSFQWGLNGSPVDGQVSATYIRAGSVGDIPSCDVTWSNGVSPNATATATAAANTEAEGIELTSEDIEGTESTNGEGDITRNITDPSIYAGTHTHDQSEEFSGPLNIGYTETVAPQCIVPLAIYRHAGPGGSENHYPGTEYRYHPSLWQKLRGSSAIETVEWYEDGEPTGFTGTSFSRAGTGEVTVRGRMAVEGQAVRTVFATPIVGEAVPADPRTFFIAPNGTLLTAPAFDDPTGRTWAANASANVGFPIHNNKLRNGYGTNTMHFAQPSDAVTTVGQWSEMYGVWPEEGDWIWAWQGPSIFSLLGGMSSNHGYALHVSNTQLRLKYVFDASSRINDTGLIASWTHSIEPGAPFNVRLWHDDAEDEIVALLDGVERIRMEHEGARTGGTGIGQQKNQVADAARNDGWIAFNCGVA